MSRRPLAILVAVLAVGAAAAPGCGSREEIDRERPANDLPGAEPAPEGGTQPEPGGISEE